MLGTNTLGEIGLGEIKEVIADSGEITCVTYFGGYFGTYFGAYFGICNDNEPAVTHQPGGGYYRKPIIYVDKQGRPVDLKTYRSRLENTVVQAARQIAREDPDTREVAKQLREAIASGVSERVAQEASAAAAVLTGLKAMLAELEQLALEEAEDEETAMLLLLA